MDSSSEHENQDQKSEQFQTNQKVKIKRPRCSDDFFETLTCKICFEFFVPPIIQCAKGHSFCQSCAEKIPNQQSQISQNENSQSKRQCPICRGNILFQIRNFLAEEQLEKTFVSCQWKQKGCNKKINLMERKQHEENCPWKPSIKCLYSEIHGEHCQWRGFGYDLPDHLLNQHKVSELIRIQHFRYLWNPPTEQYWRYRFRILKATFQHNEDPFQASDRKPGVFTFILEHYYDPQNKMLVFMVRTVIKEVQKKYKISIINRYNQENRIVFIDNTSYLDEFPQIQNYLDIDSKRVMWVPFQVINDFCYFSQEDQTKYFSLHVEFMDEKSPSLMQQSSLQSLGQQINFENPIIE